MTAGPPTRLGSPSRRRWRSCPQAAILLADTGNDRIRYIGDPVAPVSLEAPAISGQALVGQALSSSSGRWSAIPPPSSYGYQWRRCDASGNGCADIPSATSSSYTPTADDVGLTLRVDVTAANPGGSVSAESAATQPVGAAPTPPQNTSPPTISGNPVDGNTLTASPGTWTGTQPITYAYQWQRCDAGGQGCSNIAGAATSTYVVTSGDVGSTLSVRVTASNGATAQAYRTAVLGDSPRSYWRFDESSGPLLDVQGYANGTYVNNPQRGVGGLIGGDSDSAVSLDGSSQYLDVSADPPGRPPASRSSCSSGRRSFP